MAFTDESSGGIPATMLVGPAGGNSNGMFGDGGWWIVLLIIIIAALGGNWGNNGFGNGPVIMNDSGSAVQRGFDQSALITGITGLNSGIQNLSTQMYSNQIADLQQVFALQTQLAQCCCDNRSATQDVKYTIATEACATRSANAANTQAILDKLCALEIDGYRRENENLRSQLNMANLAASQTAQTSRILADNAAQTVSLEQYLKPVPIPAYIVQNTEGASAG